MKSKNRHILIIVSALLCCVILTGCAERIEFSEKKISADEEDIAIVLAPGETELLDNFLSLKSADFSGSTELEEIFTWSLEHPDVDVKYTVSLPDGQLLSNSETELDLSSCTKAQLPQVLEALKYLPELKEVNLGSSADPEVVSALGSAFPGLNYNFSFTLNGEIIDPETEALDLSTISYDDLQLLKQLLPVMGNLKSIVLGTEASDRNLSWDDIYFIQKSAPQAELKYSFTAFGKEISLDDEELILRHIPMDDEGALVKKITACMPNLRYLDMDSCGVSNESMAEIRDSLPDTDVVWRVVFGRYSVRTDVERILASNPGMGGNLRKDNVEGLKYCTKVKYLDLGHNETLDTIDFIKYMPDLETAILAMCCWTDTRPLAYCPKLDYLEIQTNAISDLRPLVNLKNLKHLNISYCFALRDITPLYELTQLERLWIGCLDPIPQEQIDEIQRRLPNCTINTTTVNPTEEGWRRIGNTELGDPIMDPRYVLLYDQLGYAGGFDAYNYYFNDPLFAGPGEMYIPPNDYTD